MPLSAHNAPTPRRFRPGPALSGAALAALLTASCLTCLAGPASASPIAPDADATTPTAAPAATGPESPTAPSAAPTPAATIPESAAPSSAAAGGDGVEGDGETVAVPVPRCPQAVAAVGFPITPTLWTEPTTPPATVVVSITGALPDGIALSTSPGAGYAYGSPTRVQTATFTVVARTTKADGAFDTRSATCTMTVKAAPKVNRIAGADRYDQSVRVATATFDTASIVYVASGEKYSDALSAAAVAAEHSAPLLLTPAGSVTPGVLAKVKALAPADIVVVGGPASVSAAAVAQLKAARPTAAVTRIDGADRYAVSRNLIASAKFGVQKSDDVYIATGANFPDALSASPAAALVDAPVLLVNGAETAPTAAERAMLTSLGADRALIVGGEASVGAGLQAELAKTVATVRYAGDDRFEVSGAVNDAAFDSADGLYLASGAVFSDALSGGVAAGVDEAPLYVTPQNCVSGEAAAAIGRLVPATVTVLGGTTTLGTAIDKLVVCPGV